MKLQAIFYDTHHSYLCRAYDGIEIPPPRRVVTIELTPEQAQALTPRQVGPQSREECGGIWIQQEEVKP